MRALLNIKTYKTRTLIYLQYDQHWVLTYTHKNITLYYTKFSELHNIRIYIYIYIFF